MSASLAVPVAAPARREAIAPWWHTALLIALFLGAAIAGGAFQHRASSNAASVPPRPNVVPIYLSLLVTEWALFAFVWRGGLRRSGTALADLVGARWTSPRDVARDAALGLGLFLAWWAIGSGWDRLAGPDHAASISGYLPRGAVESALWVCVSLSAGFVEELTFRGYLQRQFAAWTRSPWIGCALQAALFGIAHGYQGVDACLRIASFGALYGAVALWRRSLAPGMIGHAVTDVMSGIFRI